MGNVAITNPKLPLWGSRQSERSWLDIWNLNLIISRVYERQRGREREGEGERGVERMNFIHRRGQGLLGKWEAHRGQEGQGLPWGSPACLWSSQGGGVSKAQGQEAASGREAEGNQCKREVFPGKHNWLCQLLLLGNKQDGKKKFSPSKMHVIDNHCEMFQRHQMKAPSEWGLEQMGGRRTETMDVLTLLSTCCCEEKWSGSWRKMGDQERYYFWTSDVGHVPTSRRGIRIWSSLDNSDPRGFLKYFHLSFLWPILPLFSSNPLLQPSRSRLLGHHLSEKVVMYSCAGCKLQALLRAQFTPSIVRVVSPESYHTRPAQFCVLTLITGLRTHFYLKYIETMSCRCWGFKVGAEVWLTSAEAAPQPQCYYASKGKVSLETQ